nr:exopolysaccharide biosynthesis polyprenyl glycosylphosphotransferase [bacterium]
VKEKAIDEVVIASPLITRQEILAVINEFSGTDVIFRIVPGLYEATIGTMAGSPTEDIPLISPTAHQKVAWYPDLKRLIDTFGAVAGLIVSFPFMLGAAVLIKLTSPGPVIYRQVRAGLHGKIFTLYKFRTMIPGSEAAGAAFAADDDPRITRFGGFLRRFRLDELPQLYNVLINDMSLVGPRPERPVFIRQLMEEIPFYAERLAVKPGLTGWAQIVHGYASTPEEHRQKLLYDIFYIENMSPALDFLIIFRTVSVVLRGSGSR